MPGIADQFTQSAQGRLLWPGMTATNAFPRFCTSPATRCRPACFPSLLAPNKDREIGGGRATRQPGQVRKEAALTRSGSGRSSVSYQFFERIAAKADTGLAPHFAKARIPRKWVPVL